MLEGVDKSEWKKKIFGKGSEGLKNFMVRNLSLDEEDLRRKILELIKKEEENERMEREKKETIETIGNTIKSTTRKGVLR